MEIVLYQPQIPQNTGNILRTCAVTGTSLALIRPIGFEVSDKHLRRAGLDYAKDVPLNVYDSWDDYIYKRAKTPMFLFSSKATQIYTKASYSIDGSLVFGSETSGFSEEIFNNYPLNMYKIPMLKKYRCLNLSSSAAIILYEALRQLNFPI